MNKFCHSCAAPLEMPDFKGPSENYCRNCTDDAGNLKSQEEVETGLVEWFKMWQPDIDSEKARSRAAHYMKAMPVWAD